ncbi:PC-esterase domain-containing protein 1A-like [Colossoma macropomum]|uniref:PC-esterase domain-containing protein 1A-like n=1 Tax=Colossoma macropomum TaxID=42526 RepID=UPI001863B4F5|nr:PC-esterase domain-containing protein 1A-like [Colossoma macropomum]
MRNVTPFQASQLLHNKFVVVLGDSIQRSVYKDLVLLLQRDTHLTLSQLKSKGELSFEQDCLVEGGRLGPMTNGTEYREVRQYRTDHHLVRFYFITRVFSRYMESILADFKHELKPDVVIVNSCLWDVSRYSRKWVSEYKENLHKFFAQLKAVLPRESLVMWNMTMPLGKKIIGGFLVPEIEYVGPTLRFDVIEANFYGAMLANAYGLDVLDLHFTFRFSLQHRMKDGVHWNAIAHRQITCLLLAHAAQAWGVELPSHTAKDQNKMAVLNYTQASYQSDYRPSCSWTDSGYNGGPYDGRGYSNLYMAFSAFSYTGPVWQQGQKYDGYGPDFYEDGITTLPQFGAGYFSFGNVEQNNTAHNGGNYSTLPSSSGKPVSAAPSCTANNFVMKQKHTKRQYNPYTRQKPNRPCKY